MFLVVPVHRLFYEIVFNKRLSKQILNWLKQFEKIVTIFLYIARYWAKIYRRNLGFLFGPPCLVYTRYPFRSSSVCLGDCPVTNNVRSGEFSTGCAVMTRMPVSMSRPIWNQITRFRTMKLHWSVVELPRRPALLAASRRPPTAAGPTVPTTSRSTPCRFNAHPLRAVRSQTVILYYLESKDRDWPRYLKRSYVKGAGINRDCNDDIRNSIFHNKMDSSVYTNLRKALYTPFI